MALFRHRREKSAHRQICFDLVHKMAPLHTCTKGGLGWIDPPPLIFDPCAPMHRSYIPWHKWLPWKRDEVKFCAKRIAEQKKGIKRQFFRWQKQSKGDKSRLGSCTYWQTFRSMIFLQLCQIATSWSGACSLVKKPTCYTFYLQHSQIEIIFSCVIVFCVVRLIIFPHFLSTRFRDFFGTAHNLLLPPLLPCTWWAHWN